MLTKEDVDKMTATEIGNEMHRLHQIKYKDFPKQDPSEDVVADYQLLNEKIKEPFKIIDYLVNFITPNFVDCHHNMLYVWYSLSAINKDMRALGYEGYDDK